MQALAQLGILGGDADRAAARVAVVALARGHADRPLVVGDAGDLLVAVQRHQRRVPDRDRVGAERQALGDVPTVADAARHDEVDLVGEPDVLERPPRLRDRRQEGDPGLLGGDVRAGSGAALSAVEVDDVGAALGRHADVVVDARGAELELDRNLVVGRLSRLLDLQREVVGAEPVWVARRGPLVDPRGQRAHLGDLLGDLLAHQVAAEADLAPLADEELDPVGEHQVMRVEAVTALNHLVVPLGRQVALGRDHPALSRAGRGARHRRALGQCHLRLQRQGAKAHPGDVDGDVELEWLVREARAEDGLRVALLPVALDHEPRQRARQEDQVVPTRELLEHREAAHPVAPQLGLHVDVVDDLRREDRAAAEDLACSWGVVGHQRTSLRSLGSRLS